MIATDREIDTRTHETEPRAKKELKLCQRRRTAWHAQSPTQSAVIKDRDQK